MSALMAKLAEIKKLLAAAAGLIALALSNGLVPEPYVGEANTALAFLTLIGVYGLRNGQKPPTEDDDTDTDTADDASAESEDEATPEIPDSATF